MTSGAGRVLGGRYTLLTPIAQGGMGEVWKARDRVSGHIVAAKVLRPELTGEELSLSRLRLEARNSMSISHPNIANTQDSGEEDGIGWIIMELVDGHPLTDYLRGGSRIEPEYLMPILVQVAMALGAAARAGVVHRDIKPANIIVRPDGMVKLTDFGISRAKGQVNLTAAGMVMGTAQYLPPEQAMGEVATPIGDLYALGVIAYEAAAGRRPFTGETQVDIAFAHVNDPVPPLPDFVPEPLADVILHLLEKDPAKRPESGSAAVREIASAAKAMGVSVTPRPLPLPKAAQRPEEVRTPVQPSVPIVAPVRHLTRRTLPDEMLQPPSGLTPKVHTATGRHAKLPVLDEATTIAPSSAPIPITGRHAAVPRILDEAEVLPISRPVSTPTRVRRLHPETTGEQEPAVSGAVRSLTSTGRHAAVPAPAANPPAPVSAPIPTRSTAKTAPAQKAPAPAAPMPAQAATARTTTGSIPRHAAPAHSEQVPQPNSETAQRPQASAPTQRSAPIPAPPADAAPAPPHRRPRCRPSRRIDAPPSPSDCANARQPDRPKTPPRSSAAQPSPARKNSASASFKKPANVVKLANAARPKKPSVRQPGRRPRAFPSPPAPSRLAATRRPRPRRRACTGPFPSLAQPRPRSASDARSMSRGPRRRSAGRAGTSSTLAARNVPVRRPRPRTRAASSHHPSQHPSRLFARSSSQSS